MTSNTFMSGLFPSARHPLLTKTQWQLTLGCHAAVMLFLGCFLLTLSAPGWWLLYLDFVLNLSDVDLRLSSSSANNPIWLPVTPITSHQPWLALVTTIIAIRMMLDVPAVLRLRNAFPVCPLARRFPIVRCVFEHYLHFLAAWALMASFPHLLLAMWEVVKVSIQSREMWQVAAVWFSPNTLPVAPIIVVLFGVATALLVIITARSRNRVKHANGSAL